MLSWHVPAEFVVLARSAALGNPAFDGWVLELDFLMQISRADITLYSSGEYGDPTMKEQSTWTHLTQIKFHDPGDLLAIETGWLVPDRWNQGGYDAIGSKKISTQKRCL